VIVVSVHRLNANWQVYIDKITLFIYFDFAHKQQCQYAFVVLDLRRSFCCRCADFDTGCRAGTFDSQVEGT
jgi:hypothetical protein